MQLPTVFNTDHGKHHHQLAEKGQSGMRDKKSPNPIRKLDRRNAAKYIEYDPDDWSPQRSRSLDLPLPRQSPTSFRIDGVYEGEVDIICRNLGLSGPEDFAIPPEAWEARKERSVSDLLPRSRFLYADVGDGDLEPHPVRDGGGGGHAVSEAGPSCEGEVGFSRYGREEEEEQGRRGSFSGRFSSGVTIKDVEPDVSHENNHFSHKSSVEQTAAGGGGAGVGGIKGPRPPRLKPPPSAMLSRPLANDDHDGDKGAEERKSPHCGEQQESMVISNLAVVEAIDDENGVIRMPPISTEELTGSSSFTTSNEDDSPIEAVHGTYDKHRSSGFRRSITGWIQGKELGRGSFGTVYEAMSDDGFFFAVKEVSLLNLETRAKQCIQQLEQEIALLSNFEHENIVQYLGTKKVESKLFIFLELVTKGSLAHIYQEYPLGDSQASAYTRQILNGLKYLHYRHVVHRDIKCANILVDASGSAKLADFGLAKEISELTQLQSCKGSVYWMAPEVIRPQRPYGPSADIWSLGCTVLEMLTRKLPYPDMEWAQAFFKIGRGERPHIPEFLSKDAHDFIKQCTQVNPDDRPTASELLDHPFVKKCLSSAVSSSGHSSHGS